MAKVFGAKILDNTTTVMNIIYVAFLWLIIGGLIKWNQGRMVENSENGVIILLLFAYGN